jgi:hypothetical protein
MLGARLWPERMAPAAEAVQPSGRTGALAVLKSPRDLATVLSATLAAEEDRWFPWSVAAFGAGIAAYFGLSFEPSLYVAGAAVLVSAAVGWFARVSTNTLLRLACALVAASGLGFAAAKIRTERVDAPIIARIRDPCASRDASKMSRSAPQTARGSCLQRRRWKTATRRPSAYA